MKRAFDAFIISWIAFFVSCLLIIYFIGWDNFIIITQKYGLSEQIAARQAKIIEAHFSTIILCLTPIVLSGINLFYQLYKDEIRI